MSKRYLHIGINWVGIPETEKIHNLILAPGNVEDWIKYGGNCWVIYTKYDQTEWAKYLSPHLSADSSLIILEISTAMSNGKLPQWAWDWFNRDRA